MATTSGSAADFDFLMGTWNCHHRYLVQRLADCHDWIEFDGPFAARKILGGFGNIDEGAILFPPVHGSFAKGVGTFYGDDSFKGRPIRIRLT